MPMITQHWMLAWQLCDFQGILFSIAKKPYFSGFQGGPDPLSPSAPAHMLASFNLWLGKTTLSVFIRSKMVYFLYQLILQ